MATRFMHAFVSRDFDAQWQLLAPVAKSEWPSQTARAAMLQAKFPAGSVTGFTLGRPASGAQWTSGEDLVTVRDLWRVPVSTALDERAARSRHTADAFRNLALFVDPASGLVVGEGPASIDAPLLPSSAAVTRAARVPILMYHVVDALPARNRFPNDYAYQLEVGLTVTPQAFSDQMGYLASSGHHSISLNRLFDNLLYALPLPANPVVITFDDARVNPYYHAVPALREHHFTATFFVPVHFVGWSNPTQSYMSWGQIDDLANNGFWIEDHTLNHVSLWGLSGSRFDLEANVSRTIIEEHVQFPVQFLAYPGSWPFPEAATAAAPETELFPQLQALGYLGALTDPSAGGSDQLSARPYQLPRIRVTPDESVGEFAARLNA